MPEKKSFVTFTDGHTEEIVYFNRKNSNILFVTKTGIYVFTTDETKIGYFGCLSEAYKVFRLNVGITEHGNVDLVFDRTHIVESVTIDERVLYGYQIEHKPGEYITGCILVSPDAAEKEIRIAIMEDLFNRGIIKYEKMEE